MTGATGFWTGVMGCLLLATFWQRAAAGDFPPPEELPRQPQFPDPLICRDGTPVTTPELWHTRRKPELQELFQHYMYGRLPPRPAQVRYTELFHDDKALGGRARLSEVRVHFEQPALRHVLHVLLVVPHTPTRPPVFVGMNFCGNHTLLDDPRIHLPEGWVRNSCPGARNERATDEGRGGQQQVWNVDLLIERGYALASFYSGDIDPDTPDLLDGIGPAFARPGTAYPQPDDAGTIMLWAWGFHRVVDFLHDQAAALIDPQRIAVVGHSRNGKTALLAGALDERIALIVPLQAGCGGTAPSRTDDPRAESVQRINTAFPHWFCGNFKKFNEDPARLPFDQHCLIALCAPRPVFVPNAAEDLWANPSGQFELLRAATPVYRLLGVEGLAAEARPELHQRWDSRLGYYLRPGRHAMTRADWEAILAYADQYLKP